MIVLDTHVLIWLFEGDPDLGELARERIESVRHDGIVFVPAMSVWEMAMLSRRGRIDLSLDPLTWIDLVLSTPSFALAHFEALIAVRASTLEWDHRDPADRAIVSTAIELDMPLLTVDRKILEYAAEGHLDAIDARR